MLTDGAGPDITLQSGVQVGSGSATVVVPAVSGSERIQGSYRLAVTLSGVAVKTAPFNIPRMYKCFLSDFVVCR